jgi:hypothetical protein
VAGKSQGIHADRRRQPRIQLPEDRVTTAQQFHQGPPLADEAVGIYRELTVDDLIGFAPSWPDA